MPDPIPGKTGPFWNDDGMWPNLVTADSLRVPVVAKSITDLKTALELWRDKDDDSLMLQRIMTELPRAHIAPQFVMLLYNWLDWNKYPYFIFTHPASESAGEKQEILSQHQEEIFKALQTSSLPLPLKTVTLSYQGQAGTGHILVSGVGDFRIEKDLRRQIGQELGVSNSAMKSAVINSPDFHTTIRLGLIPGIVGPIIEEHLVGSIDGIFYLLPAEPESFLELAVSPVDSIMLKASHFTDNLKAFAGAAYQGYTTTEKPGYIFFKNTRPPLSPPDILPIAQGLK